LGNWALRQKDAKIAHQDAEIAQLKSQFNAEIAAMAKQLSARVARLERQGIQGRVQSVASIRRPDPMTKTVD
jgi:hypothetical protein